jgi:Ca2+-binding RTX toxin-like protein
VAVVARGVGVLVEDIAYPEYDDAYIAVPADSYVLDITPASDNDTVVASFEADLTGAAGNAFVVAASGFLSPQTTSDPAFGLLAVFPDGSASLLPSVGGPAQVASLQIIHNSPYAAASEVDVYLNGERALDNFAFREATPFLEVPAGVDITVEITAADAPNNGAPVFSTTANLDAGNNYIATAAGDPTQTSGPTAFNLFVTDMGRQTADSSGTGDILVFHGSPDAPTVDVVARGVGTLVDDISFTEYDDDYQSVPVDRYILDITPGDDNQNVVASFKADMSGHDDLAVVVAASGFLAPGSSSDPAFGLLAVLPDGETLLLPRAEQPGGVYGDGHDNRFLVRLKKGFPKIVEVIDHLKSVHEFVVDTTDKLVIHGLGGDDRLVLQLPRPSHGHLPDVHFQGGDGSDRFVVRGDQDQDELFAAEDEQIELMLNGNMAYASGLESLVLRGGSGDDMIDASGLSTFSVVLRGDAGDDSLHGGGGKDALYGGTGHDHLEGHDGIDRLYGQSGNDSLDGGEGHNRLYGNAGDDVLRGHGGRDRLYGHSGDDSLYGGGENDWFHGGSGDDVLHGDDGHDRIYGGSGHDILQAGDGDDRLYGQAGRDLLIGGLGTDRLYPSSGDDLVIGSTTDHDANEAALAAIMAEWMRGISYAERIGHLQFGGGHNGNSLLNRNDDGNTNGTVKDDSIMDVLWASLGNDWLLDFAGDRLRSAI